MGSNNSGTQIDRKTVDKIAHLSRLQLTDQEKEKIANQLSNVLAHFGEIAKLDTQNVQPLVTPTEMRMVLREDEADRGASREGGAEKMLKNAPERSGNLFKVPPVV